MLNNFLWSLLGYFLGMWTLVVVLFILAGSAEKTREGDMNYTIEVTKAARAWHWRIVHKNGKTLSHSETYSSREKAVRTAKNLHASFKRNTCGLRIG